MKRFQPLWIVIMMLSCTAKESAVQESLDIASFKQLLKNNPDILVVDVRTPEEITGGKIEGAIEIDFSQDSFNTKINQLDKEKTIVVYCAVGGRSSKTVTLMKEQGFKKVYNLDGGIEAWAAAGEPLMK